MPHLLLTISSHVPPSDDYESLPEGRHDERHPRPATRQQRRPPKDDDDWEDGSETPPSSSDEEGSEEPGRRPSRRRPSASKGKGVSEDETAPGGSYVGGTDEGAARLMAWSGGVDIGGIPEGGRLGLASGGVPLWAGKKKRGATRGHGGARNAEGGGLPGGPMEGLAAGGQTGDDVHSGPSDGGSGRSVVRLGGVNDFRGVQFRSVLNGTAESGAAQGKEGGAVGEAFQRKALGGPENQGLGNVGNQSPGGSCFGVSAQPGPGSAKKEQAGGSAAKAGPGSDGKKKIVRIRIIPPKEKVGSHPMSPPQMPAPINTPRDRSGGVEDKGGADGAETGRAGELEAGESRRSMQTPETDPNWPRLGAKASPVSKTFTGMGQPTGAQLDGGALFRPQFAPPIGQFPLGQPLAGNVPDAGPKKAKKGPAKPNKNKGAGSLAAAAPMTGPGGQQPGSAAALAAGLGAGFLGVSGASGGAPARPGHQLNQQGLMPNPAGYPLDPHAPPPNPSAGYRLNHQGPMQESVVQHLQTLQTLVSQAESNRASDGSSSLAPLQWAAQNPAFSNPPVAPKPVLAPAVRGAQNPAPSTLQTLLNLEKQQRMHGLPVSQTPQGLNTAPMYTQFRPSYAPMTNRQTGLSAGFGSGDPAGFRSLPSAPTPSSGPVLEQGLPIRRVETRQPAPQQGLRNQWQQQPSIQGLTFTVRPQTDHSQVWRGPVNAIPAPQAEGFRRAPDTFDPALTDFVYPPNQGGYAERPNHSVVLPNQGGYQQTTGYSDARWGASGGSGGGFAAHFPQDGYQKHGAIPGQLRQVAYQGSQQTVPVGSVNPTAHLSSLLGLPSGTGALQAEGGEHW